MAKRLSKQDKMKEESRGLQHKPRLLPFYTISEQKKAQFEEKKSTFISEIFPIKTFSDIDAYLNQTQLAYPDARHIAYAYVWQNEEGQVFQKSCDDKEPAGTAGKPILEVLLKEDYRNVLICVIRYFGGILLGAGGLTRAYSRAAREVVKISDKIHQIGHFVYLISLEYQHFELVKHFFLQSNIKFNVINYSDKVELECFINPVKEEFFLQKLKDIGWKSVVPSFQRESYLPLLASEVDNL